jgi:hypothetical protein
MTLTEFKFWLEGFSEQISVSPNANQWSRIKERLKEVTEDKSFFPNKPVYRAGELQAFGIGAVASK